MTRRLLLPAAAAALLLAGCRTAGDLAGGGSATEETNGSLTGRVAYVDGAPAAGAEVFVRPRDWVRDTAAAPGPAGPPDVRTDSLGHFRVASLPPGPYVVEVRDGRGQALAAGGDVLPSLVLDLATDTLRPVGGLEGRLEVPAGAAHGGFVQIYGLDRLARADASGRFAFADLPSGLVRLRPLPAARGHAYRDPLPVEIRPRDTTRVEAVPLATFELEDYATWPHARLLRVQGGSDSAAGPVAGYPLLVRLDAANFDFGATSGGDIRFSDLAGRRLRHEVERWDAAARQAVLWVRLDTLRSGDQDLVMYWGKPGAPDFSSGREVFTDLAGAWHLQAAAEGADRAAFPDASPQAAHGEGRGAARPADREGVSGKGAHFAGAQGILAAGPALRPVHQVSLSAWIKAAAADPEGGEVISLGNNLGLRLTPRGEPYFYLFSDTAWQGGPMAFDDWNVCLAPALDLRDDRWHHLAATWDGEAMRLYVDGVERARQDLRGRIHYLFPNVVSLGRLGADDVAHDFHGTLDEVRLAPVAWSADRVKADFEIQKPGSARVQFR